MKISDVMHAQPATCHAGESLQSAARLMKQNDCGAIPVVDEQGAPVGVVTDRDIALSALACDRPLSAIEVREAMSRHPKVVHVDDDVQEAERVMSRNQIRRVLVVDRRQRLAGIVSLGDLANAADKRNLRDDLSRDAVGAVLMAVSQRHHEPPVGMRGVA